MAFSYSLADIIVFNGDDKVEARKLKIIEGAKSILKTREYTLKKEKKGEDYSDLIGEKMIEGKKNRIIIRIPDKEPVGVSVLRTFKKKIEDEKFDKAIILSLSKYTHYTIKEANRANIETFSVKFPFFYLFKHKYVPFHEIASEEEIEEICSKYSITIKDLPKMVSNDPVVQLLGCKEGEVLKITRKSPTAGEYIMYRYITE